MPPKRASGRPKLTAAQRRAKYGGKKRSLLVNLDIDPETFARAIEAKLSAEDKVRRRAATQAAKFMERKLHRETPHEGQGGENDEYERTGETEAAWGSAKVIHNPSRKGALGRTRIELRNPKRGAAFIEFHVSEDAPKGVVRFAIWDGENIIRRIYSEARDVFDVSNLPGQG